MTRDRREILVGALRRLLRPLVRVLLREGISYEAFADCAKEVFVETAAGDFAITGRKPSVSRIAILTGLSRKEVRKTQERAGAAHRAPARSANRAAWVLGGWVNDPRFSPREGEPAWLPLEGEGASFGSLVRAYSGDMPVRAMLDELVRVGAAKRDGEGVRLLRRAYVPSVGAEEKLAILGRDAADLIATIDHNLGEAEPRFQRKVSYDNLPAEALPALRDLCRDEGQSLLERIDRWLAPKDRDVNPESAGTGRKRAGLAIYYFEDDAEEE